MLLQVSVGRLGIITKVKLPIVPQQAVKRTLDVTSIDGFVSELQSIQDNYKAALSTNSESAITAALKPLDEVQVGAMSCYNSSLHIMHLYAAICP